MNTVILARRVNADGTPQPVHAYSVPLGSEVVLLRAACGHTLEREQAQRVAAFAGVPCTPCLLLLTRHSEFGESEFDESAGSEPEQPAAEGTTALGRYAIALRGEDVCHLVPRRPITGSLDGRSVVQTVCGCLAWGPLASNHQRPICGECTAMPDEAAR